MHRLCKERYSRLVQTNALYFGDNLQVLTARDTDGAYVFPSASVDLIYLDPPFNSNRDYNLIFREYSGDAAEAQIQAFEDSWHWDRRAAETFAKLTGEWVVDGSVAEHVARLVESLVNGIGHNDMSAYIVMMTPRLVQLHRVLKPTGSLWLHCDPTASHYLKVILDGVFGPTQYVSEVVWKRTSAHNDPKRPGRIHDVLLYYSKTSQRTWNPIYEPLDPSYIAKVYTGMDQRGRYRLDNLTAPHYSETRTVPWRGAKPAPNRQWRFSIEELERLLADGRIQLKSDGIPSINGYKLYLDQSRGVPLQDIWDSIFNVTGISGEKLGYPTQKPLALLERIIQISSNPGDIILDPFCGCGTALIAAQKLGRMWIGIDVTHLSIAVMRARLMDSFGLVDVPVFGQPADLESARMLAEQSVDGRYEFQWWALAKIDAKPVGREPTRGRDRGIDGVITFQDRGGLKRILVSVKSGKPRLAHVKELLGTLKTEGGELGILIELDRPTAEMRRAAVEAGNYESELWGGAYPRVQILTVSDLLAGVKPNVPKFLPGYQRALRVASQQGDQRELWDAAAES